jgi:glutathione S-transferase
MITLFDYLPSQNAWKVRLLLNHLQQSYKTEIVSIFEGEGQTADYKRVSPVGAVPGIRLEDGRTLAESNAILTYLAEGSEYLPGDSFARAKVAQWLFFEGDYVQAGIASLRYWTLTGKDKTRPSELVDAKRELSLKTLKILDDELNENPYLGGEKYTIADMSAFAYTHLSKDAGLPLDDYTNVVKWIDRVKRQEGFLDIVYGYDIDPHSSGEL